MIEPVSQPYELAIANRTLAPRGVYRVGDPRAGSPLPLAEGRLSLGEYRFPIGFRIVGSSNDSNIEEIRIPYQDGSYIPSANKSAKIVRVAGMVGYSGFWDSMGYLCRNAGEVDDELQVMASYLEAGYRQLRFSGFNKSRFIWALKQRFGVEYIEGTQQRGANVEIEFICQEARWQADLPTVIADICNGGTQTKFFQQQGSGLSYPSIRLEGPMPAPYSIAIGYGQSAEFGQIAIQFAYPIKAGERVVIDCDPRSPRRASIFDGSNALGYDAMGVIVENINTTGDSSFFPYIRPGMMHIFSLVANGASGSWSVEWRDAWTF